MGRAHTQTKTKEIKNMYKMNLKKLTMSFATAAVLPARPVVEAEEVNVPEVNRAAVSKRIAEMKTAKTPVQTDPDQVKTPRTIKAKSAEPVKAKTKPERDPNSLLSNNQRTFQVVGTTMFKGVQKIWFANETATKVKNMEKQGHTEINYFSLPKAMTKAEALEHLVQHPELLPQDLVAEKRERFMAAVRAQAHTDAE
jgi:hypothetical protein